MPRHCERSEAIQKSNIAERGGGLPRRFAPRSDAGVGSQQASRFYVVWPAKTQGRQTGRLNKKSSRFYVARPAKTPHACLVIASEAKQSRKATSPRGGGWTATALRTLQ